MCRCSPWAQTYRGGPPTDTRVERMTDEDGPVGFLGRVRQRKWIVWVTIIGLLVLAGGASFIAIIAQTV